MPNIVQWQNSQENCNYPFREDAVLQANEGGVIAQGLFVDAQILVPTTLSGVPFIGEIVVQGDELQGTVNCGSNILGSFTFVPNLDPNFSGATTVTIFTPQGTYCGTLVMGPRAGVAFQQLRVGVNTFTETFFETSCIFSTPPNVVQALQITDILSGKIALVEGAGIVLVKIDESTLRLDAVGSTAELDGCCSQSGPGIKTINNVVPTTAGNITFGLAPFSEPSQPSDVKQLLRITPTINGLEFSLAT